MICKKCGNEILKENAKFCPKCGEPVAAPAVVENVTVNPKPVEAPKPGFPHDISSIWPEWKVEKQLGKGSFGVVYQAVRKDNNLESRAAIKVISIPADDAEIDAFRDGEQLGFNETKTYFKGMVDDFVSEIQLMETFKGVQNIVSVEDYKVVEKTTGIGWTIYIRMELLTPFNAYVCDKVVDEKMTIKLGMDICSALELCNQKKIIHRDIKPENIFVNDFGYFKLGDFGIARALDNATGGLSQKGTFNYMAPEVATSKKYDARVDTYSLGIVLYRLLNNNKLPFLNTDKQILNPNERRVAVERRISGDPLPAPCMASPQMAHLILKACAYNPQERFSSATEMKQALESVLNGTYNMNSQPTDETVDISSFSNDVYSNSPNAPVNNVRVAPTPRPEILNPNAQVERFDNKKKSNKKIIKTIKTVVALVVVLGVLIGGVVFFFTNPGYNVSKSLKDAEYSEAYEIYEDEVKDNFINKFIMETLAKNPATDIINKFQAGDIGYEEALEALGYVSEMGLGDTEEQIKKVESIHTAEVAIEKGDKYYEDGDYANAIREYSKIEETDDRYEDAQKKLQELYPKYVKDAVEIAEGYSQQRDVQKVVSYINTVYQLLPDDVDTSELEAIKQASLETYKSQVIGEASRYMDENDYPKAIEVLDNAIAIDDNKDFQNARNTAVNGYVQYATDMANDYMAAGDYVSAQRVADQAVKTLPTNDDLLALQKEVKRQTPTYLLSVCEPYASKSYTAYVNGETFKSGGTSYTNGFTIGWEGNASYNLDADYSTLAFTLGHVDGTDRYDTVVKVYCDGVLKAEYSVKADDLPKRYTIDVTGVSQLQFVCEHRYSYYGFGNVTVK